MLDDALRAGTMAQGEGWPTPQGPTDIGYAGDPDKAFDHAFETVELNTELGPAPAWLIRPPVARTSNWAIFVHGIGGARENGYRFLPVLLDAGLPTLMISYRNDSGAPRSPDGHHAFGLTEWRDLETAVEHALGSGAEGIVLVAESMGGGIVGQFLRQSSSAGKVKAIVLDAPAVDFAAIVRAMLSSYGAPLPGVLSHLALGISALRLPFNLNRAVVVDEIAAFAGPLFLSHGSSDRLVPVSGSDRLVAARLAPTQYLRTEADHIQSWKANPAYYDAALRAFLDELK